MPGVFEPCTRLDHLGWLQYLASQTPLSRSIGSLASCSATGPVWILVTSGSLNSNSTRARTAWFPSLCPVVMHSPVTGLFRVLFGSVSSSHHPSPLPRATYDWAYPIGSPFSIAMYGVTDSCAKTLGKYCSCTSASVEASSSPPTTRRYEIDLATHRASQVMLSHEAQCDGIVAVSAMLYFVAIRKCEYSYSSFFNIIEAFIRFINHKERIPMPRVL